MLEYVKSKWLEKVNQTLDKDVSAETLGVIGQTIAKFDQTSHTQSKDNKVKAKTQDKPETKKVDGNIKYKKKKSNLLFESIVDKSVVMENSILENSTVDKNTKVINSVIKKSHVGSNCNVGPFAHLRPNSVIRNNINIGNFVEVKNSIVNDGTKIGHHTYVGDAVIGKNCNIGCGVIFVNYNGKTKNKIEIGDNVFIGSNCNLIAPLKIESNSYICAGTTLTKDVANKDFVVGRVEPTVKKDRAQNYLKELV